MSAEWHFFATSHGKGPCDGLGGTLKRLAARASLQRPYENQILSPIEFFNFCDKDIKQIDVVYTTHDQYQAEAELLEERHLTATTIAGTQKLHSFIPVNCSNIGSEIFLRFFRLTTQESLPDSKNLANGRHYWIHNCSL